MNKCQALLVLNSTTGVKKLKWFLVTVHFYKWNYIHFPYTQYYVPKKHAIESIINLSTSPSPAYIKGRNKSINSLCLKTSNGKYNDEN